ncbi:MAG TPA: hypothetical protein PKZ53_06100 [Acidobacteriota bacterium]|nr:hypothetical protein [Acidobacteriota bacterium]HNJ40043.1 hypothetical protein [Acidobacteriota bacterium]
MTVLDPQRGYLFQPWVSVSATHGGEHPADPNPERVDGQPDHPPKRVPVGQRQRHPRLFGSIACRDAD